MMHVPRPKRLKAYKFLFFKAFESKVAWYREKVRKKHTGECFFLVQKFPEIPLTGRHVGDWG